MAQYHAAKIPERKSSDTKTTRQTTNPRKRDSLLGLGGCFITPGSAGSKASVMASTTELTILTHIICKAEMGRVSHKSRAVTRLMDSPPLTGSRKAMPFLRFV